MDYACPSCKGNISIDLNSLNSFVLRMKCPHCNKGLVMNDKDKFFMEQERLSNMKVFEDMIDISLSDGNISEVERSVLIEKSKMYGIEMTTFDDIIKRKKTVSKIVSIPILEEEYSVDIDAYIVDNDMYNWMSFAEIISNLSHEDPNLKNYRDDLLRMLSHNADRVKDLVRKWEEIYNVSESSADWDEILERKDECNEIARSIRSLRKEIEGKNRMDLIQYLKALTAPDDNGW